MGKPDLNDPASAVALEVVIIQRVYISLPDIVPTHNPAYLFLPPPQQPHPLPLHVSQAPPDSRLPPFSQLVQV